MGRGIPLSPRHQRGIGAGVGLGLTVFALPGVCPGYGDQYKRATVYLFCASLKPHTPSGVLPPRGNLGHSQMYAHTHPGPRLALVSHHTLALAGHSGSCHRIHPLPTHLRCHIVLDDNVADLAQKLSQGSESGGGRGHVLH